ncbi:MAG: type I-MYXAN CRISPR-associated protein Cas6/Cmx6 [Gammaproteobacteria bacterium]|jgi:CRISPR-associated protein Cas6|nr:type I-MYXAN CRISPR-associated protein Cas6/Cmx6 [Gammaproteobacteria bacterium]MBT7603925.1 type I-MYXAN CRISPR-associated protein Cas6/Cmx6 [Gammaproteobacteria bacterium]
MYWEEDNTDEVKKIEDKIIDVSFRVDCNKISADHAYDLFEAVSSKLPIINDIDNLAIHSVYGAESGAGWERPETEIYLSKRTRFCIRTPVEYAEKVFSLDKQTLKVGEYEMKLSKPNIKKLIITDTLFCRTVVVEHNKNEDEFLEDVKKSLNLMKINVKKMLCGKEHLIKTPKKILVGKTLLITDLGKLESIKIQELGIGLGKLYGCGIFLPHKSIAPVANE